jgi:hypothetical protein
MAEALPVGAQMRITSAATVRLRAAPETTSSILAELPLGTKLTSLRATASDNWLQVRTPSGDIGWVFASLTRKITPENRLEVFEGIIDERLARGGDSPPAWFQLIDFVERIADEVEGSEMAARFAWYRLQAVQRAARSLPVTYNKPQPYQEWVDANASIIRLHELGGGYYLTLSAVVAEHNRHVGASAADDIMWLTTTTNYRGECEGFVPCYINVRLQREGDYLIRYPAGRHANEAVLRISAHALRWSRYPMVPSTYCAELFKLLDALKGAVAGTEMLGKGEALFALDQVRGRCEIPHKDQ